MPVRINGATSGSVTLAAPATGSDVTMDLGLVAAGGLVLVTPTSIANSGGSASASGGEVTFTGVSSISLNGVFTSDANYRIVFSGAGSTTPNAVLLRLRAAGTDDTATNYYYAGTGLDSGGTASNGQEAGVTSVNCGSLSVNGFACFTYDICAPMLARQTVGTGSMQWWGSGSLTHRANSFGNSSATAFDGLTLTTGGGTMSGEIRVYGYKNA